MARLSAANRTQSHPANYFAVHLARNGHPGKRYLFEQWRPSDTPRNSLAEFLALASAQVSYTKLVNSPNVRSNSVVKNFLVEAAMETLSLLPTYWNGRHSRNGFARLVESSRLHGRRQLKVSYHLLSRSGAHDFQSR